MQHRQLLLTGNLKTNGWEPSGRSVLFPRCRRLCEYLQELAPWRKFAVSSSSEKTDFSGALSIAFRHCLQLPGSEPTSPRQDVGCSPAAPGVCTTGFAIRAWKAPRRAFLFFSPLLPPLEGVTTSVTLCPVSYANSEMIRENLWTRWFSPFYEHRRCLVRTNSCCRLPVELGLRRRLIICLSKTVNLSQAGPAQRGSSRAEDGTAEPP